MPSSGVTCYTFPLLNLFSVEKLPAYLFLSKVEQSYPGLNAAASALVLEKAHTNALLFLLVANLHRNSRKACVNLP